MANIVSRGCTFLLLGFALAACNKPASEPAAVTDPAPASDAAPTASVPSGSDASALASANGLMTATPGVATCDPGTDVKFAWDVTAKPEIANVEVWVGEAPDTTLFAAGGPTGSQDTGPWVKPGTVFVLQDQASKQEVDRIVIGGPECPPAPEATAE